MLGKVMVGLLILGFSLVSFASDGKAIYDKTCKMCHASGMAGAPKTGDKAAWSDRMAGGLDYLVKSAIEGKQGYGGFMPPRGGNPKLSDAEVKAAVSYMLEQVQ